ncbi:MAG: hypothetical protein O3A92_04995, partial [Verrucomicrobia bacterium]|nr:hypothetical protein [Verrucomicrobiota bacterium]
MSKDAHTIRLGLIGVGASPEWHWLKLLIGKRRFPSRGARGETFCGLKGRKNKAQGKRETNAALGIDTPGASGLKGRKKATASLFG